MKLILVKFLGKLSFIFGGQNHNFFLMCSKLNLSKDNENFIDFLSLDVGSQILRENMVSIHIKTGNIFYENYNTNEAIYNFLLRQQDETKTEYSCNTNLQRLLLKLFKIFCGQYQC